MSSQQMLPDDINLDDLPEVSAEPLNEADERLHQHFSDIELSSVERLTAAGKRLVEWGTAALGVFFASLALLENPGVLAAFQTTIPQLLGVVAVVAYLAAMLCGFFVSIPAPYTYNPNDLTSMENRLREVLESKSKLLNLGNLFFVIGGAALGGVIISILLAI